MNDPERRAFHGLPKRPGDLRKVCVMRSGEEAATKDTEDTEGTGAEQG